MCVLETLRDYSCLANQIIFTPSPPVLEAQTIFSLEAIKVAISNEMHAILFEIDCK